MSVERSPNKSRPKTMFALPGAGMGNNMLAEIKLKKLGKKPVRCKLLFLYFLLLRTLTLHYSY